MAQLVTTTRTEGNALHPNFPELVRSGASVWLSGWHVCLHGLESALVAGVATHAARQAHTEGPLGFRCLAAVLFASLFSCIPLSHCLLPGQGAAQDLQ